MSQSYQNNADNKSNCGGFIIICGENTLLVCSKKGKWGFPKGKKHKKETLKECAIRELYEETGLTADKINIVNNICFHEVTKKGILSVELYLAYTNNMIKPKIQDQDELCDAKWIKIDQAYQLLDVKNRMSILKDAYNYMVEAKLV
jgi:8-oxo-dGTP pyrophosphatase MutT (NUDIX family)